MNLIDSKQDFRDPYKRPEHIQKLFDLQPKCLRSQDEGLFRQEQVNEYLWWASRIGCSDVILLDGQPIYVCLGKEWWVTDSRVLHNYEVAEMAKWILKSPAVEGDISTGNPKDPSYSLTQDPKTGEKPRFRVNITSRHAQDDQGMDIIFRTIPTTPWPIEKHNLPTPLFNALIPEYGLILVAGTVGSGKTTLIASVIRHIVETRRWRVITYEDPVEYDFSTIKNPYMPVSQGEKSRAFCEFSDIERNMLRRAYDAALVGESRDVESISAMSRASEYGGTIYSTVHASSVMSTLPRLIRSLPEAQQAVGLVSLVSQTQVLIYQRLLPAVGGGLVAAREYLILGEDQKEVLLRANINDFQKIIFSMQQKQNSDYKSELSRLLKIKSIDQEIYNREMEVFNKKLESLNYDE